MTFQADRPQRLQDNGGPEKLKGVNDHELMDDESTSTAEKTAFYIRGHERRIQVLENDITSYRDMINDLQARLLTLEDLSLPNINQLRELTQHAITVFEASIVDCEESQAVSQSVMRELTDPRNAEQQPDEIVRKLFENQTHSPDVAERRKKGLRYLAQINDELTQGLVYLQGRLQAQ